MLCASVAEHGPKLSADTQAKYKAEKLHCICSEAL